MDNSKVLIDEIKQIAIQYRAEVGSKRKPWPKSIKLRIEKLLESGMRAPEIAKVTGVPYFSILHWRSRERKAFHELAVKQPLALPIVKAATLTVAAETSAHKILKATDDVPIKIAIATVTVTTPDGFEIKIDGIDQGLEILRRLRGSICS